MAEDLAVRVRTLPRWLHGFQQQGLGGLAIRRASGRAATIPASRAPDMLDWVRQGPAGCGVDRANWPDAELAIPLYPVKGLTVSATTMRMFCQRHGVRPYRPTYQDLKANPAQREIARQDLGVRKKRRGGGTGLAEPS